jgi:enterochelin esterase family protein
MSSGGICAFTVAWHHPDRFARVLSHCGSFTNIKGGHNYQSMIRTTPRKPIRVFMQSGKNDIDGLFGNWPLANKSVAQSLGFSGYDYRFEFGVGGHTLAHGGALFAEAIRWLLR